MFSIYHFWSHLVSHKTHFLRLAKLDQFPFDAGMVSCRNRAVFPDLAIRVNADKSVFTGGELIELKDSNSYTVASFNSTIPTGQKEITKVAGSENSAVRTQMERAGDDVFSLPLREVFYLVRGHKRAQQNLMKVCLVHGSFFETVRIEELIQKSFSQVLAERVKKTRVAIPEEVRQLFLSLFSEQESFSRVRNVEKASVSLRFRIMTEVKAEGNILNPDKYPQIADNTLNFVVPCHTDADEAIIIAKMKQVMSRRLFSQLKQSKIKHHFNGYFLVFQTALDD